MERLAASRAGVLGLIAANRYGLGAAPLMASQSTVYGAAASGPGLPRVGGMYGGRYSVWIPPSQDGDRIDRFNNPNPTSFPSASVSLPRSLRNFIGYLTYTQFLMDHGRDLRPDGSTHVELSIESGNCPLHNENVRGRTFQFPPREQPMHACRRSIIAAMDIVADRNGVIPSVAHRDRVGIVTFDSTTGSVVRQGLTTDYVGAMQSSTELQSVGDKGTTTATETGLALARDLVKPASQGGQGREDSTKVVVLLTDGMPNAYSSADADIDTFAAGSGSPEFYGGGYYWLDAALMQAGQLTSDRVDTYPVGIGLGTDYDFMDRMARTGATAGDDGKSSRGSGNPAQYEQRLTEIFERIITEPTAKLVK
ncbi:MAG: vWA domain-containing protein [Planctomycetota bacterium]